MPPEREIVMHYWDHLLQLDLPIIEKMLRPVIIYLFLVIALRLAGKRELAQLNSFDLIVLLTLSNTVQNAIIGNDNSLTGGIIGASTLLFINYIMVRFLFNHPTVSRILEGNADVLIEKGKICHDRLKNEVITVQELEEAAHKQGYSSLAVIQRAVIEPGGNISFFPKEDHPHLKRHEELMHRLDKLEKKLDELQASHL
jgi:uncharacterized membrane protein YcaP (DUF421 family)